MRRLMHLMPSLAMRTDALVQFIVARKWRDILVLEGPDARDAETVRALERSAKRFGARIVAKRPFVLGSDPREREQNNLALADRRAGLRRRLHCRRKPRGGALSAVPDLEPAAGDRRGRPHRGSLALGLGSRWRRKPVAAVQAHGGSPDARRGLGRLDRRQGDHRGGIARADRGFRQGRGASQERGFPR